MAHGRLGPFGMLQRARHAEWFWDYATFRLIFSSLHFSWSRIKLQLGNLCHHHVYLEQAGPRQDRTYQSILLSVEDTNQILHRHRI